MLHWQLSRSRVGPDAGDCITLLEFAESEMVFTEFVRLLVRICDLGTRRDVALCERMGPGLRLEGFFRLIFFPSLKAPYSPPSPPADVTENGSATDAENAETAEKEGGPETKAAEEKPTGENEEEEEAAEAVQDEAQEIVEFWSGFDDYSVGEVEAHQATRKWPEGYENEVAAWI